MTAETPILNFLLKDKELTKDDEHEPHRNDLADVFMVSPIHDNDPRLSYEKKQRQYELERKCDTYLRQADDEVREQDQRLERARTSKESLQRSSETTYPNEYFRAFDAKTCEALVSAHYRAELSLKRASRVEKLDVSLVRTFSQSDLGDLYDAGMDEDLLALITKEPGENTPWISRKKGQKRDLLKPLKAWNKRAEIHAEAARTQRHFIEKHVDSIMNTYLNVAFHAFGEIRTPLGGDEIRPPETISKLQALQKSTDALLSFTENTAAVFQRAELTRLNAAIKERLANAQAAHKRLEQSALQKKRSALYDQASRLEQSVQYFPDKVTVETAAKIDAMLSRLDSEYGKLQGDPEFKPFFDEKISKTRELLKKKAWNTLFIGDPTLLRRRVYEKYLSKKQNSDEKSAREWLKLALKTLEEVVSQQQDAFLKSWDQLWGLLEKNSGYAQAPKISEVDQIFFENECAFSPHTLGTVDVMHSATEALNDTADVLNQLHNDPKEVYKALLDPSLRREPYGKVQLDLSPPCLAVRLVCQDVADYTLLSTGIDITDDTQAATELGLSFSYRRKFLIRGKQFFAPLILVNGEQHTQNNQAETLRHETAHRKIIVDISGHDKRIIGEDRQTQQEKPLFPVTYQLQDRLRGWRKEINGQYQHGLLGLRDEIQAFIEELDYDFPTIETILLKRAPDGFYDFVAPQNWVEYRKEQIEQSNLTPQEKAQLQNDLQNDADEARKVYEKRVIESLQYAKKITQTFPDTAEGRAKVGTLLRFSTLQEWRTLSRYLSKVNATA